MEREEILERYLREELKVVNKSLPVKRKSLKQLIKEEYPHVITRDGGIHMFRKSELNEAIKHMDEDEADKLLLPIILELRADLFETVAVVTDEYASKLIARILKLPEDKPPLYIYPVQLNEIRKKIGTLIQYALTYKGLFEEGERFYV